MIFALGDRVPVLDGDGHYIADSAAVIGNVRLAPQVSVWFGSVLRGDNDQITIGARSNIQDGCVLHVDPGLPLVIGAGVTVGHQVMLHGCTIGDDSLIGIGTTVLNGAEIGANCVVGAHSLITENKVFPPGSLILGAPAKVVRELNEEEITGIKRSAASYVDNAARYRAELHPVD